MSAGRICRREVHVASLGESVRAVAQRMKERNVGTVVVQDERGRPAGMLTDRDLALRVLAEDKDPKMTPVLEVMTVVPRTIGEGTSIEDALAAMRSEKCRRLPVVGNDGKLVGVVSLDDILELLAEEFGTIGGLLRAEEPKR
jgi:CBS domain-containing protein